MDFAQKVTSDASHVSIGDMDELRRYGLSDAEILDVVLACSARNFFSKTLDALNATPDPAYLSLEPDLIKALSLGRPFPIPV